MPSNRNETRVVRYTERIKVAKQYPINMCTISFANDNNTAMSLRSAVCFGFQAFHIIGRKPDYKVLKSASGTMSNFINTREWGNPANYIGYCRWNNIELVSIELSDTSTNIEEFIIHPNVEYSVVIGNEYTGIPTEILHHSQHLHIPMRGIGYCLNSAMAASVAAHEFSKKFEQLATNLKERHG